MGSGVLIRLGMPVKCPDEDEGWGECIVFEEGEARRSRWLA